MDAGETPGETAVREIREELGLAVTLGTSLVVDFGAAGRARTRALPHFVHGRRGLIPEAVSLTIEPGLGSLVRGCAVSRPWAIRRPFPVPPLGSVLAWTGRAEGGQ